MVRSQSQIRFTNLYLNRNSVNETIVVKAVHDGIQDRDAEQGPSQNVSLGEHYLTINGRNSTVIGDVSNCAGEFVSLMVCLEIYSVCLHSEMIHEDSQCIILARMGNITTIEIYQSAENRQRGKWYTQ